ncbi:hypothetical protein [Methylophilus sp. 3sh_L]|jgi:hypothetical protein|uniref:hypothetical protein n=1 Tax=Methylophilus sp. 3sh_L TaxID=3377114 RepID=UPI00398F1984
MASNQSNTRGGSSEQHAKAGSQSHKNQSSNQGSSTRGGTSEQHAKAGSQSHKND